MGLEHPLALLLLPLAGLPLLRRRGPCGLPLVALDPAARGGEPSLRVRLLWLPAALWAAAVAGTIVAAAGPYGSVRSRPDRRYARDIVLAIDASESMRGMDFELDGRPASRMDAAIRFSREFIDRREGDRVGLVAFGSRALTQCPLTFDRAIARTLLGHVRAEMAGKRTALGEGIALGVARLRSRGGALILLSDGQNTAGAVGPEAAAAAAAARGVRIYAVGVGSDGPVPIPARMPSGRTRVEMKDYRLDEAALRGVAGRTGGRYFRADDAATLEAVFAEIDRIKKKPAEAMRSVPAERYAHLPALAGALSLALLLVLSASVLRTAPRLR